MYSVQIGMEAHYIPFLSDMCDVFVLVLVERPEKKVFGFI